MKVIWAFSHEQHNDPRIFNNLSMLKNAGWETVYFNAPHPIHSQLKGSLLVEPRRSFVIPEMPVQEISMSDLSKCSVDFLNTISSLSYAERMPRLPVCQQTRSHFYSFKETFKSSFCIFKEVNKAEHYVYDYANKKIFLVNQVGDAFEEQVLRLVTQAREQGGVQNVEHFMRSIHALHTPATVWREMDTVKIELKPSFEPGLRLSISLSNLSIERQILPRRHNYDADRFGGKTYNFSRFKKDIYDYTSILELVDEYCGGEGFLKPDAVLVSDLPTLPVGVMLKERFVAKLIVDCHEWWAEQEKVWNSSETEKIDYVDRVERELYSICDMRWTVGQVLAERMSSHYGVAFDYLPTCVFNQGDIHSGRVDGFWPIEVGVPRGSQVAIFQGGLTTERNLDNLMRATRELNDNQYIIVVGDGVYRSEMERVLREEGTPERVRFLGIKPQESLWTYTVNADLGIIPYTHDLDYYRVSSPNKLAEYHACRIPILVDNHMIELCRVVHADGIGISTDCRNPIVLGQSIRDLLADRAKLAALRGAYSDQKERYTYPVINDLMAALAQKLEASSTAAA